MTEIVCYIYIFHLKCLKKINAQEQTAANKQVSMTRARQLLNQYPNHTVNFMFFSNEKLFIVAAPTNSQNDRFYVRLGTRKKNVNENRHLQMRSTFSKSVCERSTDRCRTRSIIVINSSIM